MSRGRYDYSGQPYTRQRDLIPPEKAREARALLKLTQAQFAERLGVTRRTVIRGEKRGLEVPLFVHGSRREGVAEAWRQIWAAALDTFAVPAAGGDTLVSSSSPKSHPPKSRDRVVSVTPRRIRRKKSPAAARAAGAPRAPRKKRLRRSREILKARGGKRAR